MIFTEFVEQIATLKEKVLIAKECIDLPAIKSEITELKEKTHKDGFWDDPKEASVVSQNLSQLERRYMLWSRLIEDTQALAEMVEMVDEESPELHELEKEYHVLFANFSQAQTLLLLSGPFDARNALLEITSGAGGTEAQDFAEMLLRMYLRFCERQNWKAEILEKSDGAEAGIKSCLIEIKGENAYGLLSAEKGTHRLVRQSPFNAKNLRQTSFAGVMVTPELEEVDIADIQVPDSEVRVDTFRASGAGGQHVNKTDSAVRMVHIPTNIVVVCQNQRSQHQNREKAMQILKSRIAQRIREEEEKKAAAVRGEHTEAAWGTQIRNYVLHPYKLVKDLRTEYEVLNPDVVFDGDLEKFHEKYLEWKAKK